MKFTLSPAEIEAIHHTEIAKVLMALALDAERRGLDWLSGIYSIATAERAEAGAKIMRKLRGTK